MKTVVKTSIGGLFLRPYFILTALALASLALCPKIQAVSPAPDGGYPRANTAEEQNALFSLTTGVRNTANGYAALYYNTEGEHNTATGFEALLSSTTGHDNTANGYTALYYNTTGYYNTANGYQALHRNTTGLHNTATGYKRSSSTPRAPTTRPTALERSIPISRAATTRPTALVHSLTTPRGSKYGCWFLRASVQHPAVTGSHNTAVGAAALASNRTGSNNTALGYGAGDNVTTASNVICIGADGNNVNDSCYISNIFGSTSSNGVAVFVNSNGRLGTMTSSKRFKQDIKAMDKASEAILELKPVTFRYKKELDPEGASQLGLVAEDVEKIAPELVVRDKEGKPYSVATIR